MWLWPETLDALVAWPPCMGQAFPPKCQLGCFYLPFLHPREKVFERLLTNAYSALTLSRHPKKQEEMRIISAVSA